MADLKFQPAVVVGHEKRLAFGCGAHQEDDTQEHHHDQRDCLREIEFPIYAENDNTRGDRFREMRRECGLTMGDVARATGLALHEVSWLERGNASIDEDAYRAVLKETQEKLGTEPTPKRKTSIFNFESFLGIEAAESDPSPDMNGLPFVASRVLFVVYEKHQSVLHSCGSIGNLINETGDCYGFGVDDECDEPNGIYVAEGEPRNVFDEYTREHDIDYDPKVRPATKEEWLAHLNGEFLWEDEMAEANEIRRRLDTQHRDGSSSGG